MFRNVEVLIDDLKHRTELSRKILKDPATQKRMLEFMQPLIRKSFLSKFQKYESMYMKESTFKIKTRFIRKKVRRPVSASGGKRIARFLRHGKFTGFLRDTLVSGRSVLSYYIYGQEEAVTGLRANIDFPMFHFAYPIMFEEFLIERMVPESDMLQELRDPYGIEAARRARISLGLRLYHAWGK